MAPSTIPNTPLNYKIFSLRPIFARITCLNCGCEFSEPIQIKPKHMKYGSTIAPIPKPMQDHAAWTHSATDASDRRQDSARFRMTVAASCGNFVSQRNGEAEWIGEVV